MGFLRLLKKFRKHGVVGSYRIGRLLLQSMVIEIRHGARIRDKIALAIRWVLMPIVMIVRGGYPYAEFYPFDVMLRTSDGSLYYCKRGTGDCYAVLFEELPCGEDFKVGDALEIFEGTFIDVGANIGRYTVKIARQLGAKGTVVAIEPNPDVYRRLLVNIKLNKLTNVIPLNIAAGSHDHVAILHVDPLYHGFSTLRPEGNKANYVRQVEVQVRALDKIIEELKLNDVQLVKIDVEGWEANVLKGMRKIMEQCKPRIVFEAWDEKHLQAAEEELIAVGYRVESISKDNYIALPKE